MKQIMRLMVSLGVVFGAMQAHAFPLTSTRPWKPSYEVDLFADAFSVNGIIALSNCSGSFVRFKGASDDSAGLILTNGHCVGGGIFGGMLEPNEIYYHKAKSFTVNLLNPAGSNIASLKADQIIYATMTDTDMALLRLTKTYRQIREQTGVEALTVSDVHPAEGTSIEVPSGYWKRTYRCEIEAFVHRLQEADWMFTDSIRYSGQGCEVIGGTSGSPIVSTVSHEVIGINNTGNESGKNCTLNNPCEIDRNGTKKVIKGRGYGQQTYWVYSCLNTDKEFDLAVNGCVLPKGETRSLSRAH